MSTTTRSGEHRADVSVIPFPVRLGTATDSERSPGRDAIVVSLAEYATREHPGHRRYARPEPDPAA